MLNVIMLSVVMLSVVILRVMATANGLHARKKSWVREIKLFGKGNIIYGACIIKLITAVIYGFRNKLEYLSLNTRLGWKRWKRWKRQGQTL